MRAMAFRSQASFHNEKNQKNILLPLTSTKFLLKYSHVGDITDNLTQISKIVIFSDYFLDFSKKDISLKVINLPLAIKENKLLRYIYAILYSLMGVLYLKNYDAIFTLSGGPAAISSLVIKLITRKPLITLVRSDFTEYKSYNNISRIEKLLLLIHEILMRSLLRISDKIIAIYEHLYLLVRNYLGIPQEKCELIYLPVDLRKFSKGKGLKFNKSGDFHVGFVGRFSYENGSDLFLKVARSLYQYDPSIIFIFVGNKPEGQDLPPNIIITGFVPHIEIPTYLSSFDLFLSLKRSKGLPVAVIEALACGVPTIGINITDKIILHSGAVIIINEDNEDKLIESIVSLILQLKNNKEKLKEMSNNASRIAFTYFSPLSFTHKINILVTDLLSIKRHRRI
jgi:glycosyltransferase involved in cell wall biosynthesis